MKEESLSLSSSLDAFIFRAHVLLLYFSLIIFLLQSFFPTFSHNGVFCIPSSCFLLLPNLSLILSLSFLYLSTSCIFLFLFFRSPSQSSTFFLFSLSVSILLLNFPAIFQSLLPLLIFYKFLTSSPSLSLSLSVAASI